MSDTTETKKEAKEQDPQALQQKFMEFQMLEQQIKQLQEQAQKLEQQGAEVENVLSSLDDLSKAKEGDEVLVPVSGGIFFKTKLVDGSKFLVNVGAGVVVDKDLSGAKQLIKNQEKELNKFKEHITEQLMEGMMKHQMMEGELHKLMED